MEHLAGVIFDHPCKFILGSCLIAGAFLSGFFFAVIEPSAERLYSLPVSQATRERDDYATAFGVPSRASFLVVRTRDGSGLLTPDRLTTIAKIDSFIQNNLAAVMPREHAEPVKMLAFFRETNDPGPSLLATENAVAFSDICVPRQRGGDHGGTLACKALSPLDMYRSVRAFGQPVVTQDWPYLVNTRHSMITKGDLMLANPEVEIFPSGSTKLFNATGMLLMYYGRSEVGVQHLTMAWEKSLIYFLKGLRELSNSKMSEPLDLFSLAPHVVPNEGQVPQGILGIFGASNSSLIVESLQEFLFDLNAYRSWTDELMDSTMVDIPLLRDYAIAFMIVSLYAVVTALTSSRVRSKCLSAFCGSLAPVFGYSVCAGASYLLGLRHVPTINAAPFLVLGIGLDDAFVIINSYALTYFLDSPAGQTVDPCNARKIARRRCQLALKDCAIAITITTLTNIISFLIGVFTPYLSVRNFCIIAAAGLFGGYIMAFTLLFPVLCLEAHREQRRENFWTMLKFHVSHAYARQVQEGPQQTPALSNRALTHESLADTFVFAPSTTISTYDVVAQEVRRYQRKTVSRRNEIKHSFAGDESSNVVSSPRRRQPQPNDSENLSADTPKVHSSRISRWFQSLHSTTIRESASFSTSDVDVAEPRGNVGKHGRLLTLRFVSRFLRRTWVKCFLVLVFALMSALSVYEITTNLRQGLDMQKLVPPTSYLRSVFKASIDFKTFLLESYVFLTPAVLGAKVAWWDPQVMSTIQTLQNDILKLSSTQGTLNGMDLFREERPEAALSNDESLFMNGLKEWLHKSVKGVNFQDFFVFKSVQNENGTETEILSSWKIQMFNKYSPEMEQQSLFMKNIRHLSTKASLSVDEVGTSRSLLVQPYMDVFLYLESDTYVFKATISSMLACYAAIVFVSSLLMDGVGLVSTGTLLVMLMIALVDINLFGFMALLGIELNIISMILLILSIGFSVDYTVHVVHTFSHCLGATSNDRMIETLMLMGNPLAHGAMSTMLGVLPSSFRFGDYIYSMFCQMTWLVIGLGFCHGVFLLPVVLSMLTRAKSRRDTDGSRVATNQCK